MWPACSSAAKVRWSSGWASFRDGKTCDGETETDTQIIRAEHVSWPRARRRSTCPSCRSAAGDLSSTEALSLTSASQAAGGHRRGLYRARTRDRLRQAGLGRDDGRGGTPTSSRFTTGADDPVASGLPARRATLTGAKAGACADGDALRSRRRTRRDPFPADKILVTVGRRA